MPTANDATTAAGTAAGRRRRSLSKGDLKEAAILDCAWELLAHKPVAEITIEELAKAAGISRSSFYFYFDSREAVIRALGQRTAEGLFDTMSAALAPATDDTPEAVVGSVVAAYMNRWRREGQILRAMVPLYESDPENRAFWERINRQVIAAIAKGIAAERAAGRALPGPPTEEDLARTLVAMLWRSGYELSLESPSAARQRRLVDTLTTVCLRAIYGTAPTPGPHALKSGVPDIRPVR